LHLPKFQILCKASFFSNVLFLVKVSALKEAGDIFFFFEGASERVGRGNTRSCRVRTRQIPTISLTYFIYTPLNFPIFPLHFPNTPTAPPLNYHYTVPLSPSIYYTLSLFHILITIHMQFIIFQFANNTIVDSSIDFSSNRHFDYDGQFIHNVLRVRPPLTP